MKKPRKDTPLRVFIKGAASLCLSIMISDTVNAAEPSGQPTHVPESASEASVAKKEKLICKREKVLGSNRTQKVCKTQSQIDAEKASAQRFGQQIRNATGVKSTLGQ